MVISIQDNKEDDIPVNGQQEDYIPVRGDIVWMDFNPQAGSEIEKRRPALVLSSFPFNYYQGFVVVCPITHTVRISRFDIAVPEGLQVSGYIRVDQIKSLDWRERRASFEVKMPDGIMEEVCAIAEAIIWGE